MATKRGGGRDSWQTRGSFIPVLSSYPHISLCVWTISFSNRVCDVGDQHLMEAKKPSIRPPLIKELGNKSLRGQPKIVISSFLVLFLFVT